MLSVGRTYSNKTFEYTHGYGVILTDASNVTDNGKVLHISKEIDGSDNKVKINEPRIYFGLETNSTIVLNSEKTVEYDYVDEKESEDPNYRHPLKCPGAYRRGPLPIRCPGSEGRSHRD